MLHSFPFLRVLLYFQLALLIGGNPGSDANAEGLNTGFTDSYFRRARNAKGAPDANGYQNNRAAPVRRSGSAEAIAPITRQSQSPSPASNSEVCENLELELAETRCAYSATCGRPLGQCNSAQLRCRSRACVSANARSRASQPATGDSAPAAQNTTQVTHAATGSAVATPVAEGAAPLGPQHVQGDPHFMCMQGAPEVCGNHKDDNCNGFVDEGTEAGGDCMSLTEAVRRGFRADLGWPNNPTLWADWHSRPQGGNNTPASGENATAPSRVAPAQRSALPSGFTSEENTDYGGHDIGSANEINTPDPNLCAQMCDRAISGCVGYTFVDPGVQSARARCWFKSQMAATGSSNSRTVSGKKSAVTTAVPVGGVSATVNVIDVYSPIMQQARTKVTQMRGRCANWDHNVQAKICSIGLKNAEGLCNDPNYEPVGGHRNPYCIQVRNLTLNPVMTQAEFVQLQNEGGCGSLPSMSADGGNVHDRCQQVGGSISIPELAQTGPQRQQELARQAATQCWAENHWVGYGGLVSKRTCWIKDRESGGSCPSGYVAATATGTSSSAKCVKWASTDPGSVRNCTDLWGDDVNRACLYRQTVSFGGAE